MVALQLSFMDAHLVKVCIILVWYIKLVKLQNFNVVIYHESDEISPAITSSVQQTSVITVTTTVSSTAVITPQSFCSCPGQQQTSTSSSSSDSDVVTIVTPVVVVLGVIILILLVVIGVLIWRKATHQSDTPYGKAVPKTKVLAENYLHGLVVAVVLF